MNKSVKQLHDESKTDLTYADVPVGEKVRIVCPYQDGYFWNGETGTVAKNSGEGYLAVSVELDEPIRLKGRVTSLRGGSEKEYDFLKTSHGFDPCDLAKCCGERAPEVETGNGWLCPDCIESQNLGRWA